VFRTFNASFTLQNQLDGADFDHKSETVDEKVIFYDESNKEVAILCNHQKTISKTYEASRDKALERIEDIENYLSELKEHYNLLKKKKKGYESQDASEKGKIARKFPSTLDKTKPMIGKIEERINKERAKLNDREDKKGIALGTSKTNYNDPRITVAWCKKHEIPIEKCFSKDLRNKFAWAMNTEPLWKF
jgi:DNA topoisomerase-1